MFLLIFSPRALLKGPKKSFDVVLVCVKSSSKNAPIGAKNVREQKLCQIEQKVFANENCSKLIRKSGKEAEIKFLFVVVAIGEHVWPCTTKHGIM